MDTCIITSAPDEKRHAFIKETLESAFLFLSADTSNHDAADNKLKLNNFLIYQASAGQEQLLRGARVMIESMHVFCSL